MTNSVRDVSGLEVDRSRARPLAVDEAREWLAILDSDPLAVRKDLGDLSRFLLGTGCRLGEAGARNRPDGVTATPGTS